MRKKSPTIITHDGKFHADDVFAAAALLIFLKGGAKVVRTRDCSKIARGDYVVDVGDEYDAARNRFDHHRKEGAGARANGIPYAAFGLVWKKFGEDISESTEVAAAVGRSLVAPTDAEDNGILIYNSLAVVDGARPYEMSDAIRAFVPTWKEKEVSYGKRFMEAVSFARRIIEGEVALARAAAEGRKLVRKAYRDSRDKRLVILDGDYPWEETLARFPAPLFVVHPQENEWFVECVRDDPDEFVNRRDLPAPWSGLRDKSLAKASGVPDAVFCHRARFMAVARSREGALALAKLALAHTNN